MAILTSSYFTQFAMRNMAIRTLTQFLATGATVSQTQMGTNAIYQMTSEIDNLNRQRNQIFLMAMVTKTNTGIKSEKKNLIKKNTWRMSIRQKRQFLQKKRIPKLAHEKRILLHARQRSFTLTFVFCGVVNYNLCKHVCPSYTDCCLEE